MAPSDASYARSFGTRAAEYERGRPDYPASLVADLLAPAGEAPLRVADVGAGTGKLTRVLLGLGHEVVAVEPDGAMRARLAESVDSSAGVEALDGEGEELPLADASVDAVTYGQAWHWVDPVRGAAEAARVLRPGGVLALVWNIRDVTPPWVAELADAMDGSNAERMIGEDRVEPFPPFTSLERLELSWSRRMSVPELVDMAASRSTVIALDDTGRERVLDRVRALGEQQAGDDGTFELPYVTFGFRGIRP